MNVSELKKGQKGRIIGILSTKRKIRKRIIDLGFTIGTVVTLKRHSPFYDPIQVEIRGFQLSIRLETAMIIIVESI